MAQEYLGQGVGNYNKNAGFMWKVYTVAKPRSYNIRYEQICQSRSSTEHYRSLVKH